MRINVLKNIISLFFVSAFLFLRIVDFHTYSHFSDDEDKLHCELCEIITTSHKLTPFTGNTFVEVEQKFTIYFPEHKTTFVYETSHYSVTLPESIYNKPPPIVKS
ncbi:hypothetical protein [Aquimarina algiphila]|uniref:hypothetical protein n=1 Tax=Aquimarina algiphila TaxID=2047982 RepID=UPI00232F66AF|nr:hypothetical protein [Aquimarina algiphila]